MNIEVLNLTTEALYITSDSPSSTEVQEKNLPLLRGSRLTVSFEKTRPKWLHDNIHIRNAANDQISYELLAKELRLSRRRNWKRVSGEECPWRMYLLRVSFIELFL